MESRKTSQEANSVHSCTIVTETICTLRRSINAGRPACISACCVLCGDTSHSIVLPPAAKPWHKCEIHPKCVANEHKNIHSFHRVLVAQCLSSAALCIAYAHGQYALTASRCVRMTVNFTELRAADVCERLLRPSY